VGNAVCHRGSSTKNTIDIRTLTIDSDETMVLYHWMQSHCKPTSSSTMHFGTAAMNGKNTTPTTMAIRLTKTNFK